MGERLTLLSGLLVTVRIQGSGPETFVMAEAMKGPVTQEYDVRYAESVATFEAAWREGARGEQIASLAPLTGAEVFMAHLTCEVLSGPVGRARPIHSRTVGGSGTEWLVKWPLHDATDGMICVSDSPGTYVTLPL